MLISTDSEANMLKVFRGPDIMENETEYYEDGLEDLVNDEGAHESLDSAQVDQGAKGPFGNDFQIISEWLLNRDQS